MIMDIVTSVHDCGDWMVMFAAIVWPDMEVTVSAPVWTVENRVVWVD